MRPLTRAATVVAALAVAVLASSFTAGVSAMTFVRTVSPATAIMPAASSDAHKGVGGLYGGLKGRKTGPSFSAQQRLGNGARKQPYPYRYYTDESRGNYGCHRYGKRAIDTDNKNWWLRYQACKEVGSD
jgi:hypothetical protein